jgi:hypothetical protein
MMNPTGSSTVGERDGAHGRYRIREAEFSVVGNSGHVAMALYTFLCIPSTNPNPPGRASKQNRTPDV